MASARRAAVERLWNEENEQIANWLLKLTDNHRNWGFGLCFLYLRNVKGFGFNDKRVYRICQELELNLRIRPRKRLVRQAPQPLVVPVSVNAVWSMDFMHDQLKDGPQYPAAQRDRRFQPGSTGHRDRRLVTLGTRHTGSGAGHRLAGKANGDPVR